MNSTLRAARRWMRSKLHHDEKGPIFVVRYERHFGLWFWHCTRPSLAGRSPHRGPFLTKARMRYRMAAQESQILDYYRARWGRLGNVMDAEVDREMLRGPRTI